MLKRIILTLVLVGFTTIPAFAKDRKPMGAIELGNVVQLYAEHEIADAPDEIEGASHVKYLQPLLAIAKEEGLTVYAMDINAVLFPDFDQVIYGYCDVKNKRIFLNIHMGGNMAVSTLAHELAHWFQPKRLNESGDGYGGQVFAQAVSELFCQRIGLDTKAASISYLSLFPQHFDVFQFYSKDIEKLVERYLAAVK